MTTIISTKKIMSQRQIGGSDLPPHSRERWHGNMGTGVKKLRVRVTQCPPQYKVIGCHGIKSMTLIKLGDMYNVSPLS